MPGVIGEVLGKVTGGLARGAEAKKKQPIKTSSLKEKAKRRILWPENLRHYQMDILDKTAKSTSGPVRGMIYDLLKSK